MANQNIPCKRVGFLFQLTQMKKPSTKSLEIRKAKLEERLKKYELDNIITDIASFDETQYNYVDPIEAGERVFILLAIAFTAYNFDQTEKVMDWLKKEELWKSVSEKEKEFFRNPDPSDEEKQLLSFRFEGAFILAWSLDKVRSAPQPESECNEEQVNEFLKQVPAIGSATDDFFAGLRYRSLPEVLDETCFYENATAYFKNIVTEDKENTSPVHSRASFERHLALNWLRKGGDKSYWDTPVQ